MASWTGSFGVRPRRKMADLLEGGGNKMNPSADWIIREGPRWVWAATSD